MKHQLIWLRSDLRIELPPEVFNVGKWRCKVISNRNVSTFIKELKLALPEGVEVPPTVVVTATRHPMLEIDAPGDTVAELERQTSINEDVIRYMTVRVDEHEKGPSVMMRKQERSDRGERAPRAPRREEEY